MQANLEPEELVNLTAQEEGDLATWYRDWWESLPPERSERIRCVTSHFAQFLIDVVTDRPVQAFCMLREPVERVISLLFFLRWMDEHGNPQPMLVTMRERGWELKDVYLNLGGDAERSAEDAALFWRLFNGQTREILEPLVDPAAAPFAAEGSGPLGVEHQVRARLADTYLVGVSERFSQSMRLFAESFGWEKVFVPRVNVRPYPSKRSEIDEETRALIRAHNSIDRELHAEHLAHVSSLPPIRRRSDVRWRAQRRWRRSVWLGRRAVRRTARQALERRGPRS
jgi:hypothetical protein